MKVCRTCEHYRNECYNHYCRHLLNWLFDPDKQSCTDHKERVKTKKVTLRRALYKQPRTGYYLGLFDEEDYSSDNNFVRWHDSIEVKVPVEE